MTLVAALSPDSQMLLGDVVISQHLGRGTPLPPFKGTFLPSVGFTLPADPGASGQIVATRQKLVRINSNLAVGWSGPYPAARRLVSAMLDYFDSGRVTIQDITKFLTTCDYDDRFNDNLSLIGHCVNDSNYFNSFGLHAKSVDFPLLGRRSIAGSGADSFVRLCAWWADQGIISIVGTLSNNVYYENVMYYRLSYCRRNRKSIDAL